MSELRPETLLLHGGQKADPVTGAIAVPIYRTTAYAFENTEHARSLFALQTAGSVTLSYYESNC
ncbi:O-acetylhomoserine sulfhydrylase OS=Ureibacillus acetophenoni OX=614649 GN=SAMN05877842_11213 PE=3 SV=1 [Ureibacillus acetophenoni]